MDKSYVTLLCKFNTKESRERNNSSNYLRIYMTHI